jgi:hypothetical protein
MTAAGALPPLPLEAWEPTRDTLHLWAQIIGKIKLGTTPLRNHWWNVALYVDIRGLTTRRMQRAGTTFQIDLDLLDHDLIVRTASGAEERLPLRDGLSVAEFDQRVHEMLRRLGVDVAIREEPFGTPVSTIPFPDDREHAAYDGDAVRRFWRVLDWVDGVFEQFAGGSYAKTSPVHIFWHSLDLAVTRFSGRRAPPIPGADAVTREAYSHEVVSFGFWPGDKETRFPAFYAYAAPEPEHLREQPLRPDAAAWNGLPTGSLALLPYDEVRAAPDPRATLLAFLESAYEAGATTAGWDRSSDRPG